LNCGHPATPAAALRTLRLLAGLAGAAQDRGKLCDILMQREKDSWEMVKKKDQPGLRDYFGDEAVLIFSDGSRYSKAEFLKLVPDFKLDSYAIEGAGDIVVLTPDGATLIYRITYTSAIRDSPLKKVMVLSSSSYVRRDGKWLSVDYQERAAK
jgi:hypothetical protein